MNWDRLEELAQMGVDLAQCMRECAGRVSDEDMEVVHELGTGALDVEQAAHRLYHLMQAKQGRPLGGRLVPSHLVGDVLRMLGVRP